MVSIRLSDIRLSDQINRAVRTPPLLIDYSWPTIERTSVIDMVKLSSDFRSSPMTLAYERARSAQDYRFGQPSWYVRPLIRSFRWMVTNNAFLFAVAIAIVGGSFAASATLDAWHWFQRSGALLVSIGAILSTQHMLQTVTGTLLNIPKAVSANAQEHKDLVTCFVGFWVVGLGTLIWAYGDLAGYVFGSKSL